MDENYRLFVGKLATKEKNTDIGMGSTPLPLLLFF
jgi:hypothetical protein